MRRQTPVASLLYSHLFPSPGPTDPPNFQTHLARDLIPEIRIETATFYGSLHSIEARYPGLNYCYAPHRMRLGRFPHHARLFAAVDSLGITDQEIMDLARWEGTLWARQRFERDEGIKVCDTTGNAIEPWIDPRRAKPDNQRGIKRRPQPLKVSRDLGSHDACDGGLNSPFGDHFIDDINDDTYAMHNHEHHTDITDHAAPEPSANPVSHAGSRQLDHRLLAALATRSQGANFDITPELEAYLKEMVESGRFTSPLRRADGPVPVLESSTQLDSLWQIA